MKGQQYISFSNKAFSAAIRKKDVFSLSIVKNAKFCRATQLAQLIQLIAILDQLSSIQVYQAPPNSVGFNMTILGSALLSFIKLGFLWFSFALPNYWL